MRALAFALTALTSLTLTLGPSAASAADPPAPAGDADEQEGDPSDAASKTKAKSKSQTKSRKRRRRSRKPKNAEECDHRTPIFWHEVEAGEHLGLIAGRYGVLSQDIIALNPKLADNPNHIRVGQKLAVCPEIPPRVVVEIEHEVAPGETFNAIALEHELSPEELLEQQGGALSDPNKLRAGAKLRIVKQGEIVRGFEPEPPRRGELIHARKLPEDEAYYIKRSHHVYGTARTIRLIGEVVDRYESRAKGGPLLRIGDISKKSGGPMKGHRSHQEGRDLDIGLVLQGKLADRKHFSGANANNIDLRRTWILVEEFLATGEIRYIFLDYNVQKLLYEYAKGHGVSERKLDEYFQYPRGIGRNHGIIRHWPGHKNHLHVRFRR